MKLLEKLEAKDAKDIKRIFIDLVEFYMTPSFGSVKQREFDIFLFGKLQDIGLLENKDDIYEVIKKFRLTRSKARNLIYESNLRNTEADTLDSQLKEELKRVRFMRSGAYLLGIEIENPLLIDHLKSKLKQKGFSSDGSFSPEIVKLNGEAFAAVVEDFLSEEQQKNIENELIALGFKEDASFKGLIGKFIEAVAKDTAGEVGNLVAKTYITPLVDGTAEKLREFKEQFSSYTKQKDDNRK